MIEILRAPGFGGDYFRLRITAPRTSTITRYNKDGVKMTARTKHGEAEA